MTRLRAERCDGRNAGAPGTLARGCGRRYRRASDMWTDASARSVPHLKAPGSCIRAFLPTRPSTRRVSTVRFATRRIGWRAGSRGKHTYQHGHRQFRRSLREVALDITRAPTLVMVKPGLPYLDIVRRVKDEFKMPHPGLPGQRRVFDDHGRCGQRLAE